MRHGTRSAYVSGCRCEACRAANTAYMAAYYRARGTHSPLVDVAEAQWRLRRLFGMGYTYREVAQFTGISEGNISDIMGGRRERVHARAVEALDGLLRSRLRDRRRVDAGHTRENVRRIWARYGRAKACELLGVTGPVLNGIIYSKSPKMRPGTKEMLDERIAALCRPKTWAERCAERRAAGFIVNPYTDE